MSDITIRQACEKDAARLLEIYEPYITKTAVSFEYEVPSLEEFTARMKEREGRYPYLVALRGDTIVGYAYASSFHPRAAYDWSAETTVYLSMEERGKGIGAMLYDELEKRLKKQGLLNLNACIAVTEHEDERLTNASVRFHERMGFQMVGCFHKSGYKFDTWYDMVWMEKMIGDHSVPAPERTKYDSKAE